MTTGPVLTAMSVIAWCLNDHRWQVVPEYLLPPAYLSHGLWLLWALRACQVRLYPGGEMLPTKFRLILYLDVFGWIRQQAHQQHHIMGASKTDGDYKIMVQDGENLYSPTGAPAQAQARFDSRGYRANSPDNPLT